MSHDATENDMLTRNEFSILAIFKKLAAEEDGASAVEYAVLIALVISICIVVIVVIGNKTSNSFGTVGHNTLFN